MLIDFLAKLPLYSTKPLSPTEEAIYDQNYNANTYT